MKVIKEYTEMRKVMNGHVASLIEKKVLFYMPDAVKIWVPLKSPLGTRVWMPDGAVIFVLNLRERWWHDVTDLKERAYAKVK